MRKKILHHIHTNYVLQIGFLGIACFLAAISTALVTGSFEKKSVDASIRALRSERGEVLARGVAVPLRDDVALMQGKESQSRTVIFSEQGAFELPGYGVTTRTDVVLSGDIGIGKFIPNKIVQETPVLESEKPAKQSQGVLVLLINSTPDSAQYSPAEVYANFFLPAGNVNTFFRENSYNKFELKGFVSPWIDAPSAGQYCGKIDLSLETIPEVADYLRTNIDLIKYDTVMFIVHGCAKQGYGGEAVPLVLDGQVYTMGRAIVYESGNITSPYTWFSAVKDSWLDVVAIHELGHTMGLNHAEGIDCGNTSYSSQIICEHNGGEGRIEYGDMFDGMGSALRGLNFNATYRDRMGWVDSDKKVLVTQSGKYDLYPINSVKPNRLVVLYIQPPHFSEPLFAVEWRDGTKHDDAMLSTSPSNVALPQVRIVGDHLGMDVTNASMLVDLKPTSANWAVDVIDGVTSANWTDPQTGTVIKSKTVDVNGVPAMEVSIQFYPVTCSEQPPIIEMNPSTTAVVPFANYFAYDIPMTLRLKSQQGIACGPEVYKVQRSLSGYSGQYLSSTQSTQMVTIPTFGEVLINPAGLTIPEDTPIGTYNIHYVLTKQNSSLTPIEIDRTVVVQ